MLKNPKAPRFSQSKEKGFLAPHLSVTPSLLVFVAIGVAHGTVAVG